jgi:hypothetical protein
VFSYLRTRGKNRRKSRKREKHFLRCAELAELIVANCGHKAPGDQQTTTAAFFPGTTWHPKR